MFLYGEADFEANQALQEPLEKLFEYEILENDGKIAKFPCSKIWYIVDQGTKFATVMRISMGSNIT